MIRRRFLIKRDKKIRNMTWKNNKKLNVKDNKLKMNFKENKMNYKDYSRRKKESKKENPIKLKKNKMKIKMSYLICFKRNKTNQNNKKNQLIQSKRLNLSWLFLFALFNFSQIVLSHRCHPFIHWKLKRKGYLFFRLVLL